MNTRHPRPTHGEATDLSCCGQEPIHIPGAIQPHGAVLAVLAEGPGLVSHASANLAEILGHPPQAVLGRALEEVIGETACRALLEAVRSAAPLPGSTYSLSGPGDTDLDLRAHRTGRHICIDIEPIVLEAGPGPSVIQAQSILETFRHATTQGELCTLAVDGLKDFTGYDRVMAYRFHDDGHGEVIAEALAAGMEPFLGLHYPAADVPPQARQLYLRQRIGAIADSRYRPVPLLSDPILDDGTPLDLTHSVLRSASPIHCEYMRNMGTAASLTVGLVPGPGSGGEEPDERKLWGMLVCHHRTPRIVTPASRAVAGMICQVVSLLLGSLGEAEIYARRLARDTTLRALVAGLAAALPMPAAIAAAQGDLLRLVDAAGAAVRVDGTCMFLGQTPPVQDAEQALAMLHKMAAGNVLAIDDFGLRHPELPGCATDGAGALLLPLTPDSGDAILWFRPEQSRAVTWGGNPAEHAVRNEAGGKLSPRNSFAAWKEIVNGLSAPWTEADLGLAHAFRAAFAAESTQRTKAALAQLRYFDTLTGLPNRSLLQDRLTESERRSEGADAALLFLDLDRFKAVNDAMGHAAGDALLVEVARRLTEAAGPNQLAARLGGDEFVVLCHGLDTDGVTALGETIRSAIEVPFEIAGRTCHISVSIGIASAGRAGGLDLVRAADMAMYAAKQSGGNRGVVFQAALFDRAARQFEFDRDMREALRVRDQLSLVYQPIFAIGPGGRRLAGFEALLRWKHPRRGWMTANQFLPSAEQSGLILPLNDWVLATALREGRGLLRLNAEPALFLAINVSITQLARPDFLSGLVDVLTAEGVPPTALCLEVTDGILTETAAIASLEGCRALGVSVAIANHGIGYSSLSLPRRLPLDIVKFDRQFLEEIKDDVRGPGFAAAVAALAHAAGKRVVFEGIETEAQYDMVLAAGAELGQGFFLAPPMTAHVAGAFVTRYARPDEQNPASPASELPGRP